MDENYKYFPGQKVQIDLLVGECYIGDFKSSDRYKVELCNVYDVKKNEHISGVQYYYKNEIKSIKVYRQSDKNQQGSDNDNNENKDSIVDNENFNCNTETDDKDKSDVEDKPKITMSEIQKIENRAKNAIYIHEICDLYHDSIEDIDRQDSIVMNMEYTNNTDHSPFPDVITILTKKNIYIFDIKCFGEILPELRAILESTKPIKILHDARKIAKDLKSSTNIHIRSIFDTLVAHLGSNGEPNKTHIFDCVQKYFNVPAFVFDDDKNINWHHRPLDENYKKITAKNVLFVYRLYEILLHKHLLRNFYETCETFVDVYRKDEDYCNSSMQMMKNGKQYLEDVSSKDLSVSIGNINLH